MVMTGFIKFSDKIRGYCLLNKRIFMVNILCSFFQIPPSPPFSKGGKQSAFISCLIPLQVKNVLKTLASLSTLSKCAIPPFEKGGLGGI
jgi:hypothetical protein